MSIFQTKILTKTLFIFASTDDLDTKTREQLIDEIRELRQDVSGARNEISTLTSKMREEKTDTDEVSNSMNFDSVEKVVFHI